VDPLRIEARPRGEPPHDQEGTRARQRSALGVEKELGTMPPVEVRTPPGEVAAQRLHCLRPERDDALLVALSHAPDEAVVEVDGAPLQSHGFAHAQPGAVEKLHERLIAEAPRRRAVRGLDQALDLAQGERAGQAPAPSWQVDFGGRVVGALPQSDEVAVERPGGRGTAGHRARRVASGALVGQPALDLRSARVPRCPPEVGREVGEVAAVGIDGARRPSGGEEGQEALQGRIGHGRGLAPDMASRVRHAGGHGRRPCEAAWRRRGCRPGSSRARNGRGAPGSSAGRRRPPRGA
jgi:hypothetical protein